MWYYSNDLTALKLNRNLYKAQNSNKNIANNSNSSSLSDKLELEFNKCCNNSHNGLGKSNNIYIAIQYKQDFLFHR